MLSRRLIRLAQTSRATASAPQVSAVRFINYNRDQKGDVLHESYQSGEAANDPKKSTPLDAASPEKGKKAPHDLKGNKEGLGFAEQVGSNSGTASKGKAAQHEGHSGQEDITPPSFVDAVKSKLGFENTEGEAKQNRGGGVGVTGTGQVTMDRGSKRKFHTSSVARLPDQTKGQAPEESRQPKDNTHGEQNAHLKHKTSSSTPDSGKGNAAADPKLPSHQFSDASRKPSPSGPSQSARAFSTSARVSAQHSADSYAKDVDSTKPVNPKVHQVDASSGGAPVARANEQPATGEFSRAGPDTKEYDTVSKHDQPYDTPPTRGPEKDEKLRYGGEPGVNQEPPSQPDEGPAGKDAGGRKPEGRS